MNKILFVFGFLMISFGAQAGEKDLKAFNTLLQAGLTTAQVMPKVYLGADQVGCAKSELNGSFVCRLTDISGADGQGAKMKLTGAKAQSVFALLLEAGAKEDHRRSHTLVWARSIICSQVVEGVAPGSAADRTTCVFEFDSEE